VHLASADAPPSSSAEPQLRAAATITVAAARGGGSVRGSSRSGQWHMATTAALGGGRGQVMAGRSRFRAWAAEPRFAGEAYRHATGGGRTKEVKQGGDGTDEWAWPKGVKRVQRRGSTVISHKNPRWQGDLDCHESKSGKN